MQRILYGTPSNRAIMDSRLPVSDLKSNNKATVRAIYVHTQGHARRCGASHIWGHTQGFACPLGLPAVLFSPPLLGQVSCEISAQWQRSIQIYTQQRQVQRRGHETRKNSTLRFLLCGKHPNQHLATTGSQNKHATIRQNNAQTQN
jgi:hypothetical protein